MRKRRVAILYTHTLFGLGIAQLLRVDEQMEVTHDNMLFDHAGVIRETSDGLCSYCHQKPFCERCHQGDLEP